MRLFARPRAVLLAVFAATLVAGAVGAGASDVLQPYAGDPDSKAESAVAAKRIKEATGADPRASLVALVETPGGAREPAGAAAIRRAARTLADDPAVRRVVTPATIARDGRAAYVVGEVRPLSARAQRDAAERLLDRVEEQRGVTLGGLGVGYVEGTEISAEDLARAEVVAFPLLLIAAFLIFRGVIAALVPLLVGLLSIGWTLALLRVLGEVMPLSTFALNLVTALALGLSIDFSLLLVSRFREERAAGAGQDAALARTVAAAGRTVGFSALTIAAALAALLVFPQRLLYSLGLAGLLTALLTAALALVVVPALLAVLGPRIDGLAPERLRSTARVAASSPERRWYRWAHWVAARPVRVALGAGLIMLALAAPALGLDVTSADTPQELPADASARQVDDALRTRFDPAHATTPVRVVVEAPRGPAVDRYAARLADLPGAVAAVPRAIGARRTQIDVISSAEPFSATSRALVRRVRAEPAAAPVAVGGDTAAFVDQRASIASHAATAAVVASAATVIALFFMTGALVLALKTLLINALTVCATLGVLVLVFQHGGDRGALVDPGVLVYVAAIAFGLSTDYAVILLSRVREAVRRGVPNAEATALAVERTGRIVTAAAVLFAIAVGGALTSQLISVREATLGVVVAVLIDATLVRAMLVPALMVLLGRWNWWSPPLLRRLYRGAGSSAPLS